MFEWVTWIHRDNWWLVALVVVLMVLAIAWLAWAIYRREHARNSLAFVLRNGGASKYPGLPSGASVAVPAVVCAATLLFWPLYALNDYSQAANLATKIESLTGGTMNARGHGTLEDGMNIHCTFVDWSSKFWSPEFEHIPCVSYDRSPDDWPGIEAMTVILIQFDPPKVTIS